MINLVKAADDDGLKVEPLVDGLLNRGDLVHFIGTHGSGKSLTATSLAYHIATGIPWRNRATAARPVVFICPGDGGITRRRLLALAEHAGKPLPDHLLLVKEITLEWQELAADIKNAEPDCAAIMIDHGHQLTVDWATLGQGAQDLRDGTGAAVIMLQEGASIASSPGWDVLWRGQRSLDDLIVFSVEHMRASNTIGRLVFRVDPIAEAAVIVGTSARPTLRPKNMSAELTVVMDALVGYCLSEGNWSVTPDDFSEIVQTCDAYDFTGLSPKQSASKLRAIINRLKICRIVRPDGPNLLVNYRWRKARMCQSLDDLAEELAEKS